jgi:hypothetical protein
MAASANAAATIGADGMSSTSFAEEEEKLAVIVRRKSSQGWGPIATARLYGTPGYQIVSSVGPLPDKENFGYRLYPRG